MTLHDLTTTILSLNTPQDDSNRRIPSVKIIEKMEGKVAVLALRGKMMGGPEMKDLHDHVKGLMNDGVRQVVIDLGKVKWLNSSGLGALMGALTTLRGGRGGSEAGQHVGQDPKPAHDHEVNIDLRDLRNRGGSHYGFRRSG